MARRIEVRGVGQAKIINPWIAFLLSFVTLGVYYVFWYGIRNAELNDFGAAIAEERGTRNVLAVGTFGPIAAITIGGIFIVPPFISGWRFCRRVGRAQALVGLDERIKPVVWTILLVFGYFLLPFEIVYAQSYLNRFWEAAHSTSVPLPAGADR